MNFGRKEQRFQGGWRGVAWVALVTIMLNPVLAVAQAASDTTTRLKPGDVVQLDVPGRPDLNQELTLDSVGTVEIAPVGSVRLGGLTANEASILLKQKLRLFYPTLDALEISVGHSGKVRIYVMGAVNTKGVVTFEVAPTLWELLRSIGGVAEDANLAAGRIIRESSGKPEVHPVDVNAVLDGKEDGSYQMKDGDTLIIPTLVEGIPGVKPGDGVKVFGSVGVPTVVPIEEGTPLMEVLMLAGSPTRDADRTKIHWVHNDGVRNRSTLVDLDQYLLQGDLAGNPTVYPGDTINVEFKEQSWLRSTLPFILGSLAAVATIYLAYDNVRYNRTR